MMRRSIPTILKTIQKVTSIIDTYVTNRARELQSAIVQLNLGPALQGINDTGPVKTLTELEGMLSQLDGIGDLLAETLQGWQTPKIVVVGSESSGKSSVLERLMMTPLLPRNKVRHCHRHQTKSLPFNVWVSNSESKQGRT